MGQFNFQNPADGLIIDDLGQGKGSITELAAYTSPIGSFLIAWNRADGGPAHGQWAPQRWPGTPDHIPVSKRDYVLEEGLPAIVCILYHLLT